MKPGKLFAATLAAALIFGPAMAETFEVEMLNKGADGTMVFEPSFVRAAPGDTIKFVATDKSHNAATVKGMAPEGSASFKGKISKDIEVTFDVEGWYGVQCVPHFAMGMVMIVAVGETEVPEDFMAGRIPPKALKRFELAMTRAY